MKYSYKMNTCQFPHSTKMKTLPGTYITCTFLLNSSSLIRSPLEQVYCSTFQGDSKLICKVVEPIDPFKKDEVSHMFHFCVSTLYTLHIFSIYWLGKRHQTIVLIFIFLMTNKVTWIKFIFLGNMPEFCKMHVLLVMYFCVTTYNKLSLQQNTLIMSEFPWVRILGVIELGLLLRAAAIKVMTGLHSQLGTQNGKNPFPSSFRLLADFILLDWRIEGLLYDCRLEDSLTS